VEAEVLAAVPVLLEQNPRLQNLAEVGAGRLGRQLAALHPIVSQAIEAALARMSRNDQNRVWAEISAADLLFLFEELLVIFSFLALGHVLVLVLVHDRTETDELLG